jgi:hypothetical protein
MQERGMEGEREGTRAGEKERRRGKEGEVEWRKKY